MKLFSVDVEKCIACGACSDVCPSGLIVLNGDNVPVKAGGRSCIACGHCTAVCPVGAMDNRKNSLAVQEAAQSMPNACDMLSILRARRSVRCYEQKPLSDADIKGLLEAARYAPIASNMQNISYIAINNKEKLEKIKLAVIEWMKYCLDNNLPGSDYFKGVVKTFDDGRDVILRDAPTLIVAVAKNEQENTARTNCAYAFTYISLLGQSMGIGTCVGGFIDWCYSQKWQKLNETLFLEDGVCAVGFLLSGYSKYDYKLLPARPETNVYIEH